MYVLFHFTDGKWILRNDMIPTNDRVGLQLTAQLMSKPDSASTGKVLTKGYKKEGYKNTSIPDL